MDKLIISGLIIAALCCNNMFAAIPVGQDKDLQTLFTRANKLEDQAEYAAAHHIYDSILAVSIKINDELSVAYFTRLKGRAYLLANQYDSARHYAEKARELSISIRNDSILGLAFLNIASINRLQGAMDTALVYYNKALKKFRDINDTVNEADALHGLTVYYEFTGDYDKAIEAGLKSNYLFKKLKKTKNYIQSLNDLANIYETLDWLDTALNCYQLVYKLSLENNMPGTANTAMNNMAVVYYNQGKIEESKNYLLKAIAYNDSINNENGLALQYYNIASIYFKEGDTLKTIESLERSLALATEINNTFRQMKASLKLGEHYNEIGDYEKAEKYFLSNLEITINSKYKETVKKISSQLALLYAKQEKYNESITYMRLSLAYQDSLFSSEKGKIIENALADNKALVLQDMIMEINTGHQQELEGLRMQKIYLLLSFLFIVFTLFGLLIYFRMRAKKNRIISAQRIQQLEDEKKLLAAQSVIIGQENERKRIAQELHDGIGILLSSASIHVSGVETAPEGEDKAEMIKKATALLKRAGKEVRKISQNMMPGVLSKFGLKDAIEDLFDKVVETIDIEIDKQISCTNERLPENTEIMLYRIVQELINNTLKHADASKIVFTIDRKPTEIQIFYSDNGRGFDIDEVDTNRSLGLSGIRSRVDFLKGKLTLKSVPNKGTEYKIVFPVDS
jgi:signal transduction histidine kinase